MDYCIALHSGERTNSFSINSV